ncbi:MAG: CoA transferase [Desulfatiglans sp.]|jgi:crotonobetainyl-CoA:carnitine CoA-transferase CaiB-like acyl-CoA transferase|nr:CoA transferase [Thermodesulfobacteriota bacterium]MEE4353398.1 CoA transferase [Desulfatiglans sp.]
MHKPLEGIRIIEWGIFHAGPGGPAILSDMGAEVIKIEQPVSGDPVRGVSEFKNVDFNFGKESNIFFEGANRGKKSITIDLSHKEGRDIAYRLIEKCDVFFTNIRPVTVKKMKMDYETLSKVNARLIYASVTGFGSRGPEANCGGFDFQGQGKAGLMFNIGEPNMMPLLAQFGLADQATAIMASYQIVIALLMRERLGISQEVEVSLLSTVSYLMYFNNLTALLKGIEVPRHERASADPLRNYYRCEDDQWIILTDTPNSDHWETICEILGYSEMTQDTRFDSREKRLENSRELVAHFDRAFSEKPRDEWLRLFREKNIIVCAVNTTMDVINDPQMEANDYIVDYDHPELGKIRIPGFPIRFSQAELKNNIVGPKLGEHTENVLKEIGGYGDEDIEAFKKKKLL